MRKKTKESNRHSERFEGSISRIHKRGLRGTKVMERRCRELEDLMEMGYK